VEGCEVIFSNITKHKYAPIYDGDDINYQELMRVFKLSRSDVAVISGVKPDSVRFDNRMSKSTRDLFFNCALIVDELAEFFSDQKPKIQAWLYTPNPMLGEITPIFMVKSGRIEKLISFIVNAKAGNIA
jgi:hypothetical protein